MPGWPPLKNSAFTWYFVLRDADGDPVASAATLDVEYSIDGGVFADVAGVEVDEGQGFYSCPISAAEMNGDVIMLMCKSGTAGVKTAAQVIYTSTRQIDDLAFPTVSGRSIDVAVTGEVGVDFSNINGTLDAAEIGTGAITAAKFGAGAIDAAAIATGAIDADSIASGAITSAKFAAGAIDAAAIADAAIDRATFATDTGLQTIRSSTAQAGAAGTITLDASASAVDDFYNGARIYLTGATGAGQYRLIYDYVGATKVASITPNWITNPDATTTFAILPAGMVSVEAWLRVVVNALIAGRVDVSVGAMAAAVIGAAAFAAGAIDNAAFNVTETLTANPATGGIVAASFGAGAIDAAAIANGAIDAATFAAGAIDAAAIATGAIDADSIAAGAITAAKFGAGAIDAAAIATGAIDADAIALSAADEILGSVSGTADSGSTTTVVDTERTEADTDYWKGALILFTSGTLNGQCRLVTAFNPATDTITFAPATTVAVATHTYRLLPFGRVDVHFWLGTLVNALISGRVDASVGAMAAAVIAAASFAAGAIDNAAFNVTETLTANPAAGGIVAGSFGAGAIDAAALAADAGTEIAAAVWDRDATLSQVQGSFGQAVGDPVLDTNTIYKGVVTDAAGATVGVDVVAVQADTDNIQTRLPAALVGGRMDSDVGAKTGNVALSTQEKADVNVEVVDAVNVDTITLPGQSAPPLAPTMREVLGWLYKNFRNRKTQTATQWNLYNDAETVIDSKATVSDDGTTAIKQEIIAGP